MKSTNWRLVLASLLVVAVATEVGAEGGAGASPTGGTGAAVSAAGSTAAAPVSGANRYEELDQLRAENALLEERKKAAKLRSEIAGSTASGETLVVPLAAGAGAGASSARGVRTVAPLIDRGATVSMVAGERGAMRATIQLSESGTVVARVGSRVPGLGEVVSIGTNEVVVKSGKTLWYVPFAAEPTGNMIQQGSGNPVPLMFPGAAPMAPVPSLTGR